MRLIESYKEARDNASAHLRRLKIRFWVIACFILAAVLFHPVLGINLVNPILVLSFLGIISNLISLLWIMWGKGLKYNVYFAAFVDALLITIAIHYLGGIESTFSWIYAILLIAVVSLHGIRAGVCIAVVCSLLFTGLLLMEFWQIIPHIDSHRINSTYLYEDSSYLYAQLLSNYILFFLTVTATGLLSQTMIRGKKDLERTVAERTAELTEANDRLQQEITERKHAQEALQESLSLINATLESTADGILVVDTRGNIQSYNRKFVEVWRIPEEMLKANDDGRIRVHMLNQANDPEKAVRDTQELYDHPDTPNYAVLELKDGRILERHSNPQKIGEQTVGIVIGFRDVTKRIRAEEALAESEKRHRILAENVRDVIWAMDIDSMQYTYFSPSMKEMMGYSVEEALDLRLEDVLTPASLEIAADALAGELSPENVNREGSVWSGTIELEQVCKDGSKIWVETTVTFVRNADGRPVELLGVTRDITERRQAEEALAESEKRHRILAENVQDVIWALDLDTMRYTYISPSVKEMEGYTVEEAMSRGLEDVLTPASLETATNALAGELSSENVNEEGPAWSRTIELEQFRKDGSTYWVEATVTFVRDDDGRPVELLGVTRDITERRKTEEALHKSQEALRDSEQRLSTTLNAVPDMVYELTLDGTVLYANESASETLGIPLEKLGEITLLDLLDEESLQTAAIEIQKILEAGDNSRNAMYTLKASDGRLIPVEAHAVPLDRKGQAPTILGVARDISEKKQLEQQLLQAQKMESLGTLAGGIAHDFNNILGGILGYVSLMKSKADADHPFLNYLDTIEKASIRASELIAQLLGFARGGKYETTHLNLNRAIQETLNIIERVIDKSIAIETRLSEPLPMIAADAGQLQQVLMNLLVNAADAMPASGKLTIETADEALSEEYARLHVGAKPGSYVRLTLTDTGIGMDKETQKRIFEPFFTTKEEGKGTGLGLSMVYGVIKNHGGYIAVESEPGHGTTFKIYLPVNGEAESVGTPKVRALRDTA